MSLQISSTSALNTPSIFLPAPFSSCPNSTFKPAKTKTPTKPLPSPWLETRTRGRFSLDVKTDELETSIDGADELVEIAESRDTLLFSFSRLSLLLLAALPSDTFLSSLFISHQDRSSRSAEPVHLRSQSLGFLCLQFGKTRRNLITKTGTVRSLFGPFVELVKSWNLPEWLVHWGHPGNMAVVLFAMGGYGTYLGYRIRYSDDVEEKANAKDLHPKLLGAMFFFFALGAPGGITSLLTSDKPIFESPHAVTGFIGLSLLTIQTILPVLFEGNPGLRNVHGILGSGIMALFLIHAALGLQLGLSY